MKSVVRLRLFAVSINITINSLLLLIITASLPLSSFADEVTEFERKGDIVIYGVSRISIPGVSSTYSTVTHQNDDTGIPMARFISTDIAMKHRGAEDVAGNATSDHTGYSHEGGEISRYKDIPFSIVLVLAALIGLVPIARRNLKGV